jgi:hypothetical protein
MADYTVNNYNLFLDNERTLARDSTGDNYLLSLNQTPITANSSQFIKITLMDFNMYRSFNNVNVNNNVIRVYNTQNLATPPLTGGGTLPGTAGTSALGYLTLRQGDPIQRFDLAFEFAVALGTMLNTHIGAVAGAFDLTLVGPTQISPLEPSTQNSYSNNIITFGLNWIPAASAIQPLTDLALRTYIDDGECFELIGSNRIKNPLNILDLSVQVTLAPTSVTINCLYPCQLSTDTQIYLRTDVQNTNLQTASYNAQQFVQAQERSALESSRILAKITIQQDYANFVSKTASEFTLMVQAKQLTHFRLFITDSHGRLIPPNNNPLVTFNTTNLEASQDKLGNRNFECTIRVDIMENTNGVFTLKTDMPSISVPARFGTKPLVHLDYGKSGFNSSPL